MAKASKDLFDDSTMTFGEHLEALRTHLLRGLIWLSIGVGICLFFGNRIVAVIRHPIDQALAKHAQIAEPDETPEADGDAEPEVALNYWEQFLDYVKEGFSLEALSDDDVPETIDSADPLAPTIMVSVNADDLAEALHEVDPERFRPQTATAADEQEDDSAPANESESESESEQPQTPLQVTLRLSAPEFAEFRNVAQRMSQPVTLTVQEAFMTYLKVSIVAGLVLSSPLVFYEIWMFVAAGLFPHERKFVYRYGAISLVLFVAGAYLCFRFVFPFVLKFLLGFNAMLEVQPQIRLSEWISFALVLPIMFGISFQLPLVMLFLERLSIFEARDYREKRRMAILIISVLSMMLTPGDPASMILMMLPLIVLYELGIRMCEMSPTGNPYAAEEQLDGI